MEEVKEEREKGSREG